MASKGVVRYAITVLVVHVGLAVNKCPELHANCIVNTKSSSLDFSLYNEFNL